MGKIVLNPNLFIYLDRDEIRYYVFNMDEDKFQKYHLDNDIDTLNFLDFIKKPKEEEEIIDYLKKNDISEDTLTLFKKNNFIIKYINVKANIWKEHSWIFAYFYHLNTLNLEFIDNNYSNNNQIRRKYYLKSIHENNTKPDLNKKMNCKNSIKIDPHKIFKPEKSSLTEILKNRRTQRTFNNLTMKKETLFSILNYSFKEVKNIRDYVSENIQENPELYSMSKYSAFEFFLLINNVEDIPRGIYHYSLEDKSLNLFKKENNINKTISEIIIGQNSSKNVNFGILFAVDFKRYQFRYKHPRAIRNIFIEGGSLAQKLILTAEAFGDNCFLTPAINDSYVEKLLKLDKTYESAIYYIGIGK